MSEGIKEIPLKERIEKLLESGWVNEFNYLESQLQEARSLVVILQQKVEQLEKENIRQKEIIENLTTMTVCGDKKQIKNTAQYKLEQLENIRKEVIEYIKDNACYSEGHCKCSFSQIALDNLLNILNKGENNE